MCPVKSYGRKRERRLMYQLLKIKKALCVLLIHTSLPVKGNGHLDSLVYYGQGLIIRRTITEKK